jgi:hypothetical protein
LDRRWEAPSKKGKRQCATIPIRKRTARHGHPARSGLCQRHLIPRRSHPRPNGRPRKAGRGAFPLRSSMSSGTRRSCRHPLSIVGRRGAHRGAPASHLSAGGGGTMTRSWLDFISTGDDPLPDHWLGELEHLRQEQANDLKGRKRTPAASPSNRRRIDGRRSRPTDRRRVRQVAGG